MRILFSLFARMGDVCCGIPAFHALRRKFPEADLCWATLPKYAALVPKFGTPVLDICADGFGGDPGKPPGFDLAYFVQPMYRHDEWTSSGKHIVDLIADWSETDLLPEERKITIRVKGRDLEKVAKMDLPDRFAAICSSPAYSSNMYPFRSLFDAVIERCCGMGIRYVTVGGADGETLPGAIPLHGKLSISETVAAINRSAVYIGPDNGTTWLACGAQKPSKLCVVDEARLKIGVVGFRRALEDPNVHDVFFQSGDRKILEEFSRLVEKGGENQHA